MNSDTGTSATHQSLSIIMPAYNEEESISDVITAVEGILRQNHIEHEIIVVDDCSTDRTAELAAEQNITLIRHKVNEGYGATLKTGIRRAKFENIGIIDADGSYPADEIAKILSEIDNCDMVVGARTRKGAKIPLVRRPTKWFLNLFANYLTGHKIQDLNSGLRIMKKEVVTRFMGLLPDGFSFTTTITIAMHTNGYRVKYIPIGYEKRKGKSKIRPIRDTINFFNIIVRTALAFAPLRVFVPFSMFFLIPGLVFIARDLYHQNIAQASILLLVTGGQILAIGFLADLINRRL